MSATIYAGASQMVGIDLFGARIAPWAIVLAIFAVNFRHLLYSAAAGRRIAHWPAWQKAVGFFMLVDPQFAETEKRGEQGFAVSFRWYMAMALPIYVLWIVETWIGAAFGRLLSDPEPYGLDFVLAIYFLALLMGFRARPLWLPVVLVGGLAASAAWLLVGSPWHVGLGALAGVALAALLPLPKPGAAR